MRFTVINLIITCLLGSLIPAISQDAPMVMSDSTIRLRLAGGQPRYLGQNSGDYVIIGTEPGEYKLGGDSNPLKNGQSYKITLGGKYLYETAIGNVGFESEGKDDKSSWKIEKQKGQCANKDDLIRSGDTIQLSNVHHKDNYLCDFGKGYAAAGTYNKPRSWIVEFDLPTVTSTPLPPSTEIIEHVIYIDNQSAGPSEAIETAISLSVADEVGVNDGKTSQWETGASVTAEAGGTIKAAKVGLSVTVSAAYGEAYTKEKTRVQSLTLSKSVTVKYNQPDHAEALITTKLAVPYQNVSLSCEGAEPIRMRSINGSVDINDMSTIIIPRRNRNGELVVEDETKVNHALGIFARTGGAQANSLRTKRLLEWQKAGWVTARAGLNAVVLAPGSSMNVKEKYWSENKEFYAIFQPDGNFGVSTKTDGYKWDIFTIKKTPLGAKKMILDPTGNLVFLDKDDKILWSIAQVMQPVANSTLNVSNSGDILLLGPDGTVLWNGSK